MIDTARLKRLKILFEDNHLIAVHKEASDISQGDKTGDLPLGEYVKAYIKEKSQKPGNVYLGTIHRLDRPVSGIVVFAKTSKALERMNKKFHDKEVQKTYWAIVEKAPKIPSEKLIHYLEKDQSKNKSRAYLKSRTNGKRAELDYQLIGSGDRYHFIEVLPHTGRHHQIRVQLSTTGMIIKGDLKYGAKRSNKDTSISLHARFLEFNHPVTKELVKIEDIPNPSDSLWKAFQEFYSTR